MSNKSKNNKLEWKTICIGVYDFDIEKLSTCYTLRSENNNGWYIYKNNCLPCVHFFHEKDTEIAKLTALKFIGNDLTHIKNEVTEVLINEVTEVLIYVDEVRKYDFKDVK